MTSWSPEEISTPRGQLDLSGHERNVLARLTGLEALAAAEDRDDAAGDERLGLLVLVLVGLLEVVATLRVADDAVSTGTLLSMATEVSPV